MMKTSGPSPAPSRVHHNERLRVRGWHTASFGGSQKRPSRPEAASGAAITDESSTSLPLVLGGVHPADEVAVITAAAIVGRSPFDIELPEADSPRRHEAGHRASRRRRVGWRWLSVSIEGVNEAVACLKASVGAVDRMTTREPCAISRAGAGEVFVAARWLRHLR